MIPSGSEWRGGFSLIDILAAVLIGSFALIPLWGLMRQSGRQADMSSVEVLASAYGTELAEQLMEMAGDSCRPRLAAILSGTGKPLRELLEGMNDELSDSRVQQPRIFCLEGTEVGFLVSPLDGQFTRREFQVLPVRPSAPFLSSTGNWYQVVVRLTWVSRGESTGTGKKHVHETVVFLGDGS